MSSKKIEVIEKNMPVGSFLWRDRRWNLTPVKDMTTQHLFFTLRMVWNHSAPQAYRIEPYKRYHFGTFYTNKYIRDATRSIALELSTRADLTPYFISCLKKMQSYFNDTMEDISLIKNSKKLLTPP